MFIGALQPAYLPWLGFFDQLARVDLFILYDQLPFQRKSWRVRNRIKTASGPRWLTVPVTLPHYPLAIDEVRIAGDRWARQHWRTIECAYRRAPYFDRCADLVEPLYRRPWTWLVELDRVLVEVLAQLLGIDTPIVLASDRDLEGAFRRRYPRGDATDRIAFLCQTFGAEGMFEGAMGAAYLDLDRLAARGLRLVLQEYAHPLYEQLHGPFEPYLSALDLAMNAGPAALRLLAEGQPDYPAPLHLRVGGGRGETGSGAGPVQVA